MKNNKDEELVKGIILRQANMYLDGLSLREIAFVNQTSHVTVHNNITNRLKYIDKNLYNEVMTMIKENTPKSIEDKQVVARILRGIHSLLNDDKTIIEIANDENTNEFVIYRDLTRRLKWLHEKNPELISKDIILKVNDTLKKHSMDNLGINHGK